MHILINKCGIHEKLIQLIIKTISFLISGKTYKPVQSEA